MPFETGLALAVSIWKLSRVRIDHALLAIGYGALLLVNWEFIALRISRVIQMQPVRI